MGDFDANKTRRRQERIRREKRKRRILFFAIIFTIIMLIAVAIFAKYGSKQNNNIKPIDSDGNGIVATNPNSSVDKTSTSEEKAPDANVSEFPNSFMNRVREGRERLIKQYNTKVEAKKVPQKPSVKETVDDNGFKDESPKVKVRKLEEIVKESFEKSGFKYSIYYRELLKNDGEIYSVNVEQVPASDTIKVFVMLVAFDHAKGERLKLDERFVSSRKISGYGKNEENGYTLSVNELLNAMMVKDNHVATDILIERIGRLKINAKLESLGFTNTVINRLVMDSSGIDKGMDNFTSVLDMGNLLAKLHYNTMLGSEWDNKMLELLGKVPKGNKIGATLPDGVALAHKSGEFRAFGIQNDAGIVRLGKKSYVLCVYTKGNNSEKQISTIASFSKKVYDNFRSK